MNLRRRAAVTGVLSIAAAVLCGALAAAPATSDDKKPDGPTKNMGLELRYAQAQYDLAETNLKKLELANQRFPKTLSAAVIAEYAEDLAIAKGQLESAQQGNDPDLFTGWLRRAQSNLKSAEAVYSSAVAANQRQPGMVDNLDIKRLKLRVEITKLQYERGQLLASAPLDAKLQWQVQVLNDEVARLKEQTSRISPQNRMYPWRY